MDLSSCHIPDWTESLVQFAGKARSRHKFPPVSTFGSLSPIPFFFNISAWEPIMAHWLSMISPLYVFPFGAANAVKLV
jgi:hypothetical protein